MYITIEKFQSKIGSNALFLVFVLALYTITKTFVVTSMVTQGLYVILWFNTYY